MDFATTMNLLAADGKSGGVKSVALAVVATIAVLGIAGGLVALVVLPSVGGGGHRLSVRQVVAELLMKKGPYATQSVPALTEALQDDDSDVRTNAVTALGKIGPDAKQAIPALAEALKVKGSDSFYATLALAEIGPSTKAFERKTVRSLSRCVQIAEGRPL